MTAAAVAAVVSGAPSTIHALARGANLLDATRAAGTALGRPSIVRGLAGHVAVSLGWAAVLGRLPRRDGPAAAAATGAAAGAAIAALDLGLLTRRLPAVRALPKAPQVADHLAYGAAVALVLWWFDRRRAAAGG